MIDPKHECRAVVRPELGLSGDGVWLHTDGVGLPVLLGALAAPGITWFSTVIGDHADELRIIATRVPVPSAMHAPPGPGPVTRFIGDGVPVVERELTEGVAQYFGSDILSLHVDAEVHPGTWTLAAHDEHWAALGPLDEFILGNVVQGVLGQLAYVVKQEIEWDEVGIQLRGLLVPGIFLRLDTREGYRRGRIICVAIQPRAEQRYLRERLVTRLGFRAFRTVGRIHIEGGRARLTLVANPGTA